MASVVDMDIVVESLNASLVELEKWKSDINMNIDQFFLLIMGFLVYRKY